MKPWIVVEREVTVDGTVLELVRRGDELVIRADHRELMSSRAHASEEALADIGCEGWTQSPALCLVGGLGMGYTLRRAIDRLPKEARVVVVEISAAVIAWNRGPLAALANDPCSDPRVTTICGNVVDEISRATKAKKLDCILLDVDNGPEPIVSKKNALLYDEHGLARAHRALSPNGRLAIWTASDAPALALRMERAGFAVTSHRIGNATANRGKRHVVLLGTKTR